LAQFARPHKPTLRKLRQAAKRYVPLSEPLYKLTIYSLLHFATQQPITRFTPFVNTISLSYHNLKINGT
jgi:hypothetical protein